MAKIINKLGTYLIICGILAVGMSLFLMLRNDNESLDADDFVFQQLPQIQNVIAERAEEQKPEDGYITPVFDNPDNLYVHNYKMEAVTVNGYTYIGYITIPAVNLELPVMDRWNEELLRLAPCRYYGSFETNDLVIAGHNYKSSFGKLKLLHKDDEVYFTDMNGIVHTYVVAETEILNATDVKPMIESDWDLSLYTCTYNGKQRFTVRCAEVIS